MRKGFTILEVMVAAAILAVGTLGVLGMQLSVGEYNRSISMRMAAVTLAEQQLAILELQAMAECPDSTLCKRLQQDSATQWKSYYITGENYPGGNAALASSNGIFLPGGSTESIDHRFYIAYYNLANASTNYGRMISLCPDRSCLRGAIRVVWAKNSTRVQQCRQMSTFENLEDTSRRFNNMECDFVSLPFVFSTTNIYKT